MNHAIITFVEPTQSIVEPKLQITTRSLMEEQNQLKIFVAHNTRVIIERKEKDGLREYNLQELLDRLFKLERQLEKIIPLINQNSEYVTRHLEMEDTALSWDMKKSLFKRPSDSAK